MKPVLPNAFFYVLFTATTTFSFKIVINPDDSLPMEQKVVKHGYPLEKYKVTTEEGYILTVYRIPHGIHKDNTSSIRSPVLLASGMGVCPVCFICMGKYRSLPYYLADRGFDVWLVNTRACNQSEGHVKYDLDRDKIYWDYSFHELGVYDLPRIIDSITEKTGQKPFMIGHSQGNTNMFVMLTERPEYNEKVKMAIVYAPSVVSSHIDIPVATLAIYIVEIIEEIYKFFDFHEFYPFGRVGRDVIQYVSNVLCSERTYIRGICTRLIDVIGTHASKMIDEDTKSNIIASERARFSSRTMFHYMQISKSGRFARYNYGKKGNLKRYGTTSAPLYDMTKVTLPVAVFYALRDDYTTVKGALETIDFLPNVVYQTLVPDPDFNHIDFILGSNATTLVYEPTIQMMKKYDEGGLDTKRLRK